MSLSALAAQVAPTNAAAAKNVIECFMVLTLSRLFYSVGILIRRKNGFGSLFFRSHFFIAGVLFLFILFQVGSGKLITAHPGWFASRACRFIWHV
jgi:hypothetical protein